MGGFSVYEQFKKLVSNYYAYSFLFVSKPQHKSKSLIDKTIFTALYKLDAGESAESTTSGVLEATKLLRKEYLKEYTLSQTFDENKAYALFSLMDYYNGVHFYLRNLILHNTGTDDSAFCGR